MKRGPQNDRSARTTSQSSLQNRLLAESAMGPELRLATDATSADDISSAQADGVQEFMEELDAALRQRGDLDEEGREFLLDHYRQALENQATGLALNLTPVMDAGQWQAVLQQLVVDGVIADGDRDMLIRQFGDVVDTLQTPEFATALEFAERCERDGQENAVAWLKARREVAASQKHRAGPMARADDHAFRQSVTPSRSRQPRGPPGKSQF